LWARAHLPIIAGGRGWCLSLALLAALGGCRGTSPEATPAPAPEAAAARPAAADKGVVLAVGTSLTAGYGLPDPDLAYPGLLEKRVEEAGLPYRVVNAGVSGETSAGALRRMDWLLRQKIDVLLLETGAYGDLTFRCNVDYRGAVTNLRVRPNTAFRRPY
jgi:acyl-CoA thioesterase-1